MTGNNARWIVKLFISNSHSGVVKGGGDRPPLYLDPLGGRGDF